MDECISLFLQNEICQKNYPNYACFAIAGAVNNNKINELANIKWPQIDGDQIAEKFGFKFCQLLNDFHAVGYSALSMNVDNNHQI